MLRAASGAASASSRPEWPGLRSGARRRHTAPLWRCSARSRRGLPGELGLGRRSGGSDRRGCAGQLGVPGGALSDDAFPVALGAEWTPRPGLQFGLQVGALLGRSVEVRGDSGEKVFDEDADLSAYLGFGLSLGL